MSRAICFLSVALSAMGVTHGQQLGTQDDLNLKTVEELIYQLEATRNPERRLAIVGRLTSDRSETSSSIERLALEGNENERLISLTLLAEMKNPATLRIAIICLSDSSIKVQRRAAYVLMQVRKQEAYQPLLNILSSTKDVGVLKSAIAALGAIKDPNASAHIRPYLVHDNASVRANTAIALAALGSEEGFDTLLKCLNSQDLQAQREGTLGLGYFNQPKARELLDGIISRPDANWKTEAQIALARLELVQLMGSDQIKLLQRLIEHSNAGVRTWAIDQLCQLDSEEAFKLLALVSTRRTTEGFYASTKMLLLHRQKQR